MNIRLIVIALIVLFMTSCTQYSTLNPNDKVNSDSFFTPDINLTNVDNNYNNSYQKRYIKKRYKASIERIKLSDRFRQQKFTKTKQLQRAKLKPKFIDRKGVKVSVENIPVAKFIDLVFGAVLKLNYSYSNAVKTNKATISLNMQRETTPRELFDIAVSMLRDNNIAVEQIRTLFQFDKQSKSVAIKAKKNFIYGRDFPLSGLEGQNITVLFPYYYVPLRNMLRSGFTSSSPVVKSIKEVAGANVLTISGEAKEVHRILEAARLLDQSSMKSKKAVLFKMRYIQSKDFLTRVSSLLRASGIPVAKNTNSRGVLMVDVPELNSIYVVSSKQSWINTIASWHRRFDNISVLGDESHIFFYKPSFRKAEELVGLINKLLGNIGSGVVGENNSTTVEIAEDFAILDEQQNNIMINTTAYKYKEILSHLERLDKTPKQILIEVTIAEVKLIDELKYGIEWYLKKNNYTVGTQGSMGIGSGGILGTILNGDLSVILNASSKDTVFHVLSSPKLIVLDRESASINIGDQVPILTSNTTSSNPTSTDTTRTQSVEYRNTGIILSVTPYVNSKGILTLDISQEVSNVSKNSGSNIDSPIISTRNIKTKVALKSGETVMLGGLISKDKSTVDNKVPLLGDLPLLGGLFKTTSDGGTKTELFITVKPTIINNTDDTKIVTGEMRKLFENIKR
ncbi:General secretion pathway protein D [hydrothermal vent metagenome]|uniref:General secretion pathway protein D n=1 Tax=hydrothermal vent metagenome TaxID=652676 RepID=A0A1W1EIJ6_9ZZZZ